jgi:hypothetical protein
MILNRRAFREAMAMLERANQDNTWLQEHYELTGDKIMNDYLQVCARLLVG